MSLKGNKGDTMAACLPGNQDNIRHNLLFIGKRLPLFDRTAAHRRLFALMRLLVTMGHRVTYAADMRGAVGDRPDPIDGGHDAGDEAVRPAEGDEDRLTQHVIRYIGMMRRIGADLILLLPDGRCLHSGPTGRPQPLEWPQALVTFGYDMVVLTWSAAYIPTIRAYLPRSAIVIDAMDLSFVRQQREAAFVPDAYNDETLRRNKEAELRAYRAADVVITVTEAERRTLLAEAPEVRRIVVVPIVHNPIDPCAPFSARRGFLFVGNLAFEPNLDAVQWLSHHLLDRLRAFLPDAEVTVIGGGMSQSEAAALSRPGLRFAGYVPQTAPYLACARVSLAPLRFGAGIKGKVGEALAHGVPVVATTIAAEGMGLEPGVHVLVADDPSEFARRAAHLHEDAALWARLSEAGREHVRALYGDGAVMCQLGELLATMPSPA